MTVYQRNLEHKKSEMWIFICRCLEDYSKPDSCVSLLFAFLCFFKCLLTKSSVLIIIINLRGGNKKEQKGSQNEF